MLLRKGMVDKLVKIIPCVRHELTTGLFRILVILTIFAGLLLQVSVTRALEPAWNYTRAGGETGGIAV